MNIQFVVVFNWFSCEQKYPTHENRNSIMHILLYVQQEGVPMEDKWCTWNLTYHSNKKGGSSWALCDIAALDQKLFQFNILDFIVWELHLLTFSHMCWWLIIATHICKWYLNISVSCFLSTPVSVNDTNKWNVATG